jgi:hypothetical protein
MKRGSSDKQHAPTWREKRMLSGFELVFNYLKAYGKYMHRLLHSE